ncbi:hypothetical protein BDQ17DRAFT_1494698 [Cyathus striatus]|nr:hypothetical protein BDQ17DRAFT_1494698 [Cyathus striatus]
MAPSRQVSLKQKILDDGFDNVTPDLGYPHPDCCSVVGDWGARLGGSTTLNNFYATASSLCPLPPSPVFLSMVNHTCGKGTSSGGKAEQKPGPRGKKCGPPNESVETPPKKPKDPSEHEAGGDDGLGSDDDDDLHWLDMAARVHVALAFQSQSASQSQGHSVGTRTYPHNLAQERENVEEENHYGNEGSHDVEDNGDAPYQVCGSYPITILRSFLINCFIPRSEIIELTSVLRSSHLHGSILIGRWGGTTSLQLFNPLPEKVSQSSLIQLKDQPLEFQYLLKTEQKGWDELAYRLRTNFNIGNEGAKVLQHRLEILHTKSKHVVSSIVGPYYGIDAKRTVDERRSHILALINDGDYVYPRTPHAKIFKSSYNRKPEELEVTIPMVTMIATAQSGEKRTSEFNADMLEDIYIGHTTSLKKIRDMSLTKYHVMMYKIFSLCRTETMSGNDVFSKVQKTLDFDGMSDVSDVELDDGVV